MERLTVYFNGDGVALGVRGSDVARDYEGRYSSYQIIWTDAAEAVPGCRLSEVIRLTGCRGWADDYGRIPMIFRGTGAYN